MEIKKANIVWLVALILIFLTITGVAGYFALRNYAGQQTVEPTQLQLIDDQSGQNKTVKNDATLGKIYSNDKYGFEWILPVSWKEYFAEERNPGFITFGLPLQTDVIDKSKKLDIWTLAIVPLSEWSKVDCSQREMCFVSELARNDKFVFAVSSPFSFVGFDPCGSVDGSIAKQETYACSVYKDIGGYNSYPYDLRKSFLLKPTNQ